MTNFDIIGDIHGYIKELKQLLKQLDYKIVNGVFTHPTRKVLFVGDYIDRGPEIKETLGIVKAMVDAGNAIALMGNHEYNAIMFHTENSKGGYLRKHDIKNIGQHYGTLASFKNCQKEYNEYIEWFKTLPLFYEDENIRAVHAAWDEKSINILKQHLVNNCLTDELIVASAEKGTKFNEAIEITLKGKELSLPDGITFLDSDKNPRKEIRIMWWEEPTIHTYQSIAVLPQDNYPDIPVDKDFVPYSENDKPVFFGHYWLNDNEPSIFKKNICCVDYSVAKDGYLTAYCYNGETELNDANFVSQRKIARI